MKFFVWKGKGNYTSQKYDLKSNVKYEIGKNITEKDAERINEDFNKLVDIISDEDKKEDKPNPDKKEDKPKVKII